MAAVLNPTNASRILLQTDDKAGQPHPQMRTGPERQLRTRP